MRRTLFIFILSALAVILSSKSRTAVLQPGLPAWLSLVRGKVFAAEVILRCTPQTGTFKVGDTFTVDYYLDTGGRQTTGADIIATYDTEVLTSVSTNSTVISTDTNWKEPAVNSIDASLGKIQLDFGSDQEAFSGNSSIGQVIFKAKAAGQAQFSYAFFQPNDNTTPAVAKVWGEPIEGKATNILTNVNNCIYTVEVASSPSPTSSPAVRPTVSELPRSGGGEVAGFFMGLSCLLIFLGLSSYLLSFSSFEP